MASATSEEEIANIYSQFTQGIPSIKIPSAFWTWTSIAIWAIIFIFNAGLFLAVVSISVRIVKLINSVVVAVRDWRIRWRARRAAAKDKTQSRPKKEKGHVRDSGPPPKMLESPPPKDHAPPASTGASRAQMMRNGARVYQSDAPVVREPIGSDSD